MNLKKLHTLEKPVSTFPLFKSDLGTATAIQILKGEKLREHTTKIPALLICIEGNALFENEKGVKENLSSGDYVHIEPNVIHWVEGIEESQLVLIK